MSRGIDVYLAELRGLLANADPAVIQDAVADAEEHLRSALAQALESQPGLTEDQVLPSILEEYGSPEETAAAYREIETRVPPPFSPPATEERDPFARFVGVLVEPRAYAALFYMFFSLITGIVYFTWAVTGISLSAGLIVMIIGLPFFGLFLFSIQGLAFVEGRLVEALLGVRMPRRPATATGGEGLWGSFVSRVKDRRTWTTMFYLILKLPLGVLSFSFFIVLLAYSLELMALPILMYFFDLPLIIINNLQFHAPVWLVPILVLAGLVDLIVILHLAKLAGRLQGALAKSLLVQT